MARRRVLTIAIVVTTVLSQGPAWAIFGTVGRAETCLLRIRGYVGNAPADARVLGPLTVGIDSKRLTLQLTDVQMLNGPVTEGRSVLRAFELYDPNLLFVGDPQLVDQVREAPPGAYLTIFGYIVGEQRMLLVEIERPGGG